MNNDNLPWSDFAAFPDPLQKHYLFAPIGPGVYELINISSGELIYAGEGGHVAWRMTSLLPKPLGKGTRKNYNLRKYVLENIHNIHYRTLACTDKATAKQIQDKMIVKNKYLFN